MKPDHPIRESDKGVWRVFADTGTGLQVQFPSNKPVLEEHADNGLRTVEADTARATYRLLIRKLGSQPSNLEIDNLLTQFFQPRAAGLDYQLLELRDIDYRGRLGKAIRTRENQWLDFGRCYVVNSSLILLSVTIKERDYSPGFQKWINKFFDSFSITMVGPNEA